MPAINKIHIEGFKAFPKEFELELKGKNLLMYGENGSGKSSIYYALHCLFQSPLKSDAGKKYFDTANDQNLKNINNIDADSKIWIDFEGRHPFIYLLDKNGYNTTLLGGGHPLPADINGCFINHQFIFHFFNFRNSQWINLFTVFIKDILPFCKDDHSGYYIGQMYDEISSSIIKRGRHIDPIYINNIEYFNKAVKHVVEDINIYVSDIFNQYFRDDTDSELQIRLRYDSNLDKPENDSNEYWLKYDNIIERVKENDTIVERKSSYKKLNAPFIGLEISEIVDGEARRIAKPQSFFNEAKLTAIALSIRFSLLNLDKPADGRFLALDDMLISLDMSNRMKVVDFLLNIVADKYRIYLFTHDKQFYSTFKKRITINKAKDDWIMGDLHIHDIDENDNYKPCTPFPIFIEDKDMPLDMMEYYAKHDYPACGQRLRKWCEELLENLYPDSLKKRIDPTTGNTIATSLNDRINSLDMYCEKESIDFSKFKDLKIYKDNILNAVSHYDIESPIYKIEILKIMRVLGALNDILENRKDIKVNHEMGIELIKPDGTPITICIDIKRDKLSVLNFMGNNRISYYVKCYIKKIIVAGTPITLPEIRVFDSIYTAHEEFCREYAITHMDNLLDIIYDHGVVLRDKL